eukprot:TRINITY_DN7014_c0_g3_i5.p1 TRINITY_DN7014_c0_g3~~TRINITY_DN7014_c0_g3_i5.p1  ORF type:complete len:516 (+),score=91.38 TRINITY_DN7014_c0_g3_i5:1445-2992(+)
MCVGISFSASEERLLQDVVQVPGCDACFLGGEEEANPAILVLSPDRLQLTTFSFNEVGEKYEGLQKKYSIKNEVKSIHSTPINEGRVVLYQLSKEHALHFSHNKDTANWNLDPLNDPALKLSKEEFVSDINWQNRNTCAVVTNQRIVIADGELSLVWEFRLSQLELSSTVVSSWWLGNTLLFNNCTHLCYLTVYHPPCCIISLPEPRALVGALLDRVFTFQSTPDDKSSNIKVLPLALTEPLLVGYLQTLSLPVVDKEVVANVLERLDTTQISNRLVQALNNCGLHSYASELVNRSSFAQFRNVDRIEQAMRQNEERKAIEYMIGIKDLKNSPEHLVIEAMLKYHTDPIYMYEAAQIKKILKAAIGSGNYRAAYMCAQLLNDQVVGRRIVSGTEAELQLINALKPKSESLMTTDLECIISAESNANNTILHEEKPIKNWQVKIPLLNGLKKPSTPRILLTGIKSEQGAITYSTQLITASNNVIAKALPNISKSSLRECLGYDMVTSNVTSRPLIK